MSGRYRYLGYLFLLSATIASRARAASALANMAPEITKGLGSVPDNVLVVTSPLESDVPAPKGDELVKKIGALVAGKLGRAARSFGSPLILPDARAAAAKSSALIFLRVVIEKGQLRVTADEYPVITNVWDRIRLPPPETTAHAFANAPIDAEIRASLTPILLEQAAIHKAKHDETNLTAAACGDVDGDGGMELLLVSRSRVVIGHVVRDRFVVTKSAAWGEISSRAPVPFREPLGSAWVGLDRISVAMTDRNPVWLDGSLTPRGSIYGLPLMSVYNACVKVSPESSTLGDIVNCDSGSPIREWSLETTRFDTIAMHDGVNAKGESVRLSAVREPNARLHLRSGYATTATIDHVGAQLVAADLDLDGVPEIVTTAETIPDSITIQSVDNAGLRPRRVIPVPEGVRALCVCPPEDRGSQALIAVTDGEVWVVH